VIFDTHSAVVMAIRTVRVSSHHLWLRLQHDRNRRHTMYLRPYTVTVWRAPLAQPSSTRIGQSEVNATTTSGYGNSIYSTGIASHYVRESGATRSTSARARISYPQLLTDNRRVTEATARPQASPTIPDYDEYGYRSSLTSSHAESRETF
jgi:hypothetical protein